MCAWISDERQPDELRVLLQAVTAILSPPFLSPRPLLLWVIRVFTQLLYLATSTSWQDKSTAVASLDILDTCPLDRHDYCGDLHRSINWLLLPYCWLKKTRFTSERRERRDLWSLLLLSHVTPFVVPSSLIASSLPCLPRYTHFFRYSILAEVTPVSKSSSPHSLWRTVIPSQAWRHKSPKDSIRWLHSSFHRLVESTNRPPFIHPFYRALFSSIEAHSITKHHFVSFITHTFVLTHYLVISFSTR